MTVPWFFPLVLAAWPGEPRIICEPFSLIGSISKLRPRTKVSCQNFLLYTGLWKKLHFSKICIFGYKVAVLSLSVSKKHISRPSIGYQCRLYIFIYVSYFSLYIFYTQHLICSADRWKLKKKKILFKVFHQI